MARFTGLTKDAPKKTIDVFLSYTHADKSTVRPVIDQLRQLGLTLFNFDDELHWGQDIYDTLAERMDATRSIVVFVSHAFRQSKWCQRELDLIEARTATSLVLPVKLDDAALPAEVEGILCLDAKQTTASTIAERIRDSLREWSATRGLDRELLDDTSLIKCIHEQRDVVAFQVFFDRHFAEVYQAVAYYSHSRPVDVHDIVQDVFIRLWELLCRKDEVKDPLNLLRLVTRTCCSRYLRETRQRPEARLPADVVSSLYDPSKIDPLEEKERYEAITTALATLSPKSRHVIRMLLFEGRSYAEIAAELKMSGDDVTALYHSALQQLRTVVQNSAS